MDGITLLRHNELFHHQLRPTKFFQKLNANINKIKISKLLKYIPSPDVIINFNYDYYFLKKIFPSTPLITLLNDDFVGMSKPWMKREAKRVLSQTVELSNHTLTVSNYIKDCLYPEKKMKLFLPWSEVGYIKPQDQKVRNTVLYFGYISFNKIDWNLLKEIAEKINFKFRIVGVLEGKPNKAFKDLLNYDCVEFIGPANIDYLDLSDVCCSIAPYNKDHPSVKSITLNNRAMQLLSRGIPMVIPQLPYLIDISNDIIWDADSNEDFIRGINYFHDNFLTIQPKIEKFVKQNTSLARNNELIKLIRKI